GNAPLRRVLGGPWRRRCRLRRRRGRGRQWLHRRQHGQQRGLVVLWHGRRFGHAETSHEIAIEPPEQDRDQQHRRGETEQDHRRTEDVRALVGGGLVPHLTRG